MLTVTVYNIDVALSNLHMVARSTLHAIESGSNRLRGTISMAWNDDGSLALDPPPQMRVEVPVDSLASGNNTIDAQMREMVGSRAFPNIVAEMQELRPADKRGGYSATGRIEVKGTSRTYAGNVTVLRRGEGVTVDGETTIDMRDFGIKPPKILVLKVQPEITIRLHLEAAPA